MKRKFIYTLSALLLATPLFYAQRKIVEPTLMRDTDKALMEHWVDSVFNTMTQDDRVGQLIFMHVGGKNTARNKQIIANLVKDFHVGGVLFSKSTPADQIELTNWAQSNAKIPLMITFDGEWGLSMRLNNTTRFPKNMMLGAIQNDSLLYLYGQEMARQCRIMGIHVNFAPDIDVNSNPSNPVIGTRSFGEDPRRVSKLGIAYSEGLESGGVMSVAKHFPGHGDTSTDSHKTLPLIAHSINRLDSVELVPFKDYIDAGLSGMMIGHLNIPSFDKSGLPSSLSKEIVTNLLQDKLGFSGLIFTDGLAMTGVSTQKDMSVNAILAGNDVLLGPISSSKEFRALKEAVTKGIISEEMLAHKVKRILSYKYILGASIPKELSQEDLIERLNTPQAEWLNRKLNEKAITLLKNDSNIIPLKNLDISTIAAIAIGGSSDNAFHKSLKLYDNVDCFNITDVSSLSSLQPKLSKYSTLIISIHNNKPTNQKLIQDVIKGKQSILVFFTTPYNMTKYVRVVKSADAIVLGYENTPLAQDYTAQGIFGGNAIEGRLPVTIKELFNEGTGLHTEKTRLSYNMPEEVGMISSDLNSIEQIVNEGIQNQAYPGCQVLIAKDGVVVYDRSFGSFEYNKLKPVTNDDIYDLASMTKAVATLPAIMKLYDDRQIKLQSKLSQFVPALNTTDKADITVRQALLHETGLTSFIQYYLPAIDQDSYSGRLFNSRSTDTYNALLDNATWGRTDFSFKLDLVSVTPRSGFSLKVADGIYISDSYPDTIVKAIADSKLRNNKNYLYSCLNFMLLKEAIETIAETDLNTFLQTNFYKRLGAYTTTYNPLTKFPKEIIVPTERDNFLRKQLLQGYVHDEGAAFMGGISGNAGLFSNANDMAKLCQMFLNDGIYGSERYLSKETTRLFTSTKSAKSRRGLGFDKPDPLSSKASPTSPSTPVSTYGHTGFTGTAFWVDPDNNLIYIFLSNRVNESRAQKKINTLSIRPRIQEEIYKALK